MSARTLIQACLLAGLAVFYAVTACVALRPQVSQHYRDYYIDRSTTDWRIVRSAAGLADGMDFADPVYPADVDYAKGLSRPEVGGRWSDANLAPLVTLRLLQPLAGALCLDLRMRATAHQAGAPVMVRIGKASATVVPPDGEPHDYRIQLQPNEPADSIDIEPTRPVAVVDRLVGNVDRRRTAIQLVRLQLRPGACPG